jgi:hypothetical protein
VPSSYVARAGLVNVRRGDVQGRLILASEEKGEGFERVDGEAP